jgi:hypothetical protein
MYHGLAAYRKGERSWTALKERAETAGKESCCWSDEPIGPIGIFVDPDNADIHEGLEKDAFSFIDSLGFRYSQKDTEWKTETETGWEFYKRISNRVKKGSNRKSETYAEFFAIAEADAVWVQDKEWLYLAKMVARKMDLPLIRMW